MLLNAKVLKVRMEKVSNFDEVTSKPIPLYFLEADVLDDETYEKYQCSFREDPWSELLRNAHNNKMSEEERDILAAEVEAEAKQELEDQQAMLTVIGVNQRKNYITLLVKRTKPLDSEKY